MKEHRIAFCTDMVRAYQQDRKHQTRRLINPQPQLTPSGLWVWGENELLAGIIHHESGGESVVDEWTGNAPYAVGDVLLIGEKLVPMKWGIESISGIAYAADAATVFRDGLVPQWLWKVNVLAARYCPKWAVRYRAEVTEVRHQRVQEITETDAAAEGIVWTQRETAPGSTVFEPCARDEYIILWDSLNAKRDGGKYAWLQNPAVWAYTFRELESKP